MMVDDLPAPGAAELEPILIYGVSTIHTKRIIAHLSLICFAIVKNACSTLVAFFADVSRKGMAS